MTMARLRVGQIGEDHACAYLRERGYRIVARNSRTRFGELDAIALIDETLVFIEVKTMRIGSRSGPESPVLAVGSRKQMQIRRLARGWLSENACPPHRSIRFDVIGITLDRSDRPATIDHLTDAF